MKKLLYIMAGVVLSACSTAPLPLTDDSYYQAAKLQQRNLSLNHWFITAQVSLTTEQSAYHFNSVWQQDFEQYQLRFHGPFGQGNIKLNGDQYHSVLNLNNEQTLVGKNPEDLIQRVTPFTIPIQGLKSWVRGIAHKRSPSDIKIQADGKTNSIQQDGWLIKYNDWETDTVNDINYHLPSDLELSHPKMHIRMRISQWQPQAIKPNTLFDDLN